MLSASCFQSSRCLNNPTIFFEKNFFYLLAQSFFTGNLLFSPNHRKMLAPATAKAKLKQFC
jgi:hypothetical protein